MLEPKNRVTGSFTHTATAHGVRSHTRYGHTQLAGLRAGRAPTLHMWGWSPPERVCTLTLLQTAWKAQGACAPRPGRHPGCGCSYTCPAQASSAGNPPAAPGMCQLGLRQCPPEGKSSSTPLKLTLDRCLTPSVALKSSVTRKVIFQEKSHRAHL